MAFRSPSIRVSQRLSMRPLIRALVSFFRLSPGLAYASTSMQTPISSDPRRSCAVKEFRLSSASEEFFRFRGKVRTQAPARSAFSPFTLCDAEPAASCASCTRRISRGYAPRSIKRRPIFDDASQRDGGRATLRYPVCWWSKPRPAAAERVTKVNGLASSKLSNQC